MNQHILAAVELARIRIELGKLHPICPACDSSQIQLINWPTGQSAWRCRHCTTEFPLPASVTEVIKRDPRDICTEG